MIEIERKFLVDYNYLKNNISLNKLEKHSITQGYLSSNPTVRIRRVFKRNKFYGYITIKSKGTISREEYEYEIPEKDAENLLKLVSKKLSKIRYFYKFAGNTWEIDCFIVAKVQNLWLAEIELDSEDQEFIKPEFVLEEVSYDPSYKNSNLAL